MSDKTPVILVGMPGDMATRIAKRVEASDDFELAKLASRFAFAGYKHKGKVIDEQYREEYALDSDIKLITPDKHEETLDLFEKFNTGKRPIGINFADAEGFDVNHLFVNHNIPFICGSTGVDLDREVKLEEAVKGSEICSVRDMNMDALLTIVGSMLKYGAGRFESVLRGYHGFGIEEHQASKADGVSGTLVKWKGLWEEMGINFYAANGSRQGDFGHAYHIMRISSPEGDVNVNLETDVRGREPYAIGTVRYAAPHLVEAMERGEKGKIFSMEDVLAD